jgi:hypothetical protein
MGQDIDRRMGDEIDVVRAAGERTLEVAGVEGIVKFHDALTMQFLDHAGSADANPIRIVDGIVKGIVRRSIGKKTEPVAVPRSQGALQPGVACLACAPLAAGQAAAASAPKPAMSSKRQLFRLFGLCPAGVLPDENGEGAAPPFLRFLSAFGFFFSLLLRI